MGVLKSDDLDGYDMLPVLIRFWIHNTYPGKMDDVVVEIFDRPDTMQVVLSIRLFIERSMEWHGILHNIDIIPPRFIASEFVLPPEVKAQIMLLWG